MSPAKPLSDADRVAFLRHLLLPEVGERGQQTLLMTSLRVEGDPRARAVAERFLERSGVRCTGGEKVDVGDAERVQCLAGNPALEPAAALLCGSFYAVETIKSVLNLGSLASLDGELNLAHGRSKTGSPSETSDALKERH